MDDKGEEVDLGLFRLQILDAGLPVQIGHEVEIGVLAEGVAGSGRRATRQASKVAA